MNKKTAMVLAGLVLFASGAVMGFIASRLLGDRGPLAMIHGDPRQFAAMALHRMSSDLDLTDEQQEKLRPLIMDTARQILAIRREQEPRIRELITTSIELTKAMLTPEQREKFSATMARLESRRKAMDRFGPPPPPPGMEGYPPPPGMEGMPPPPHGFGPPPGMEGFPPPHGFGPPPGMEGFPPPPPDLFDPEWDLPPPGPHPGPPPGDRPGSPPARPSGQPPAAGAPQQSETSGKSAVSPPAETGKAPDPAPKTAP
ncbi:hypothetical protein [Desulfovibrio sp. TomC]|uniref:hypothetical protein n=1 Tax=Desulfovibrio sp. TomC TaxID=1562888 RepID=UPI000574B638|nr:hypothetical protein [Desulfovibrio sp. TomC]KHK02329.1 hypothetical protein NY78_2087 [Desulfovibrio sp. TomC]